MPSYFTGKRGKTVAERFWSKVDQSGDCWLWKGCVVSSTQQGVFCFNGKKMNPARSAWLLSGHADPMDRFINHTCGNNLCVRPEHLIVNDNHSRFWINVEKGDGCWIWKGAKLGFGYGMMRFNGRNTGAHRASWLLHFGEIPEAMFVCHRCDNPGCVRPDHLFLGTHQDNVADAVSKGRQARGVSFANRPVLRGEACGASKLTEAQVIAIRAKWEAGNVTKMDLVREFGVTHPTIRRIISRKIWRHVLGGIEFHAESVQK